MSSADGSVRHVRRYGSSGPAVLCLHGGPGAPGELAPVARRLGGQFRVLEPFERHSRDGPLTLRVHLADLRQLVVRGEELSRVAVLGFSSGAITALAFASTYPELTSAVVLVGAATLTPEGRGEYRRRLAVRLSPAVSVQLAELERMPETDERLSEQAALVTTAYLVDPLSNPQHDWIDARGHRETWQDMLRLQEIGEHPGGFHTIRCPVLMIHGAEDPHPGKMIRDSLRPVLPQLTYRELASCGHYPWLERAAAEEFFRSVESWLAQHAEPLL